MSINWISKNFYCALYCHGDIQGDFLDQRQTKTGKRRGQFKKKLHIKICQI